MAAEPAAVAAVTFPAIIAVDVAAEPAAATAVTFPAIIAVDVAAEPASPGVRV